MLRPLLPIFDVPDNKEQLLVAWGRFVRPAAQLIHDLVVGRNIDSLPARVIASLRDATLVLIGNIVSSLFPPSYSARFSFLIDPLQIYIGGTPVKAARYPGDPKEYYAPLCATLVFAMAEHFVSMVGYTGDADPVSRCEMFETLAHIQSCMFSQPGYRYSHVDFSAYSMDRVDPGLYGIDQESTADFAKGVTSESSHRFGQGLERYLGEGETAYIFPRARDSCRFVRTRSNSPESQ